MSNIDNPTLKQVKQALRLGGKLYLQTRADSIEIQASKKDFLDVFKHASNNQHVSDYDGIEHGIGCYIDEGCVLILAGFAFNKDK